MDDLFEVMREFMTTNDPEARESAAQAITEIIEPDKTRVRAVIASGGKPQVWIEFIGGRIRDLRAKAGLTQEELDERSGLTQSHICRLERVDHSPNGLTLEKIAKGLGVPTSAFDPAAQEHSER